MENFISNRKRMKWLIVITSVMLVLALASALVITVMPSQALDDSHSYDMTARGNTDTVNGAIIYAFTPTDSTGTGYWKSFLRVSASNLDVVQGWNSDYKKSLQYQEDAAWTQSFLLQDVPQVMESGTLYREFQLDINQNASGTNALLSIDVLEVWLTSTLIDENLTPKLLYPFTDGVDDMHFVWSLDDPDDNVILLNFNLNPGSGKRDFKIQIPDALFDDSQTYVVLYTRHGGDAYTGTYDLDADPTTTGDIVSVTDTVFPNNDGFEEWGVTKYPATKLGTKFWDTDADGEPREAGEPGLEGWTIYVDYNGNGVHDVDEPYDVTDADGNYEITGIEPGTWNVREVEQEGWTCSYPAAGFYPAEVFGNGAYVMGNDFGNWMGTPALSVTKTGDTLSKIGDDVTYHYELENSGDFDLDRTSVIDDKIGNITSYFPAVLTAGQVFTVDIPWTIPSDASDPYINTVTAIYEWTVGAQTLTDTSAWGVNLFQPSIVVTKTGDSLSKVTDPVNYTITIENTSSADTPELVNASVIDTLLGDLLDAANPYVTSSNADGTMSPGELWTITATRVVQAGDPDPLPNTVTAHFNPARFPNDISASASAETDLVHPNTMVTITPDVYETLPGGNVILTIKEKNTGDWPLENVYVVLEYVDNNSNVVQIVLNTNSSEFIAASDTGSDDILSDGPSGDGEEWVWVLDPIMIWEDTTFVVNGYGNPVGLPNNICYDEGYLDERADVLVEVGEATRTWGFWKTHLYLVQWMDTEIIDLGTNPINLGDWGDGDMLVDSVCSYMGLMWASQSHNSDGTYRTKVDAARVHTAHQALAAIMNSYMPNGAPLPVTLAYIQSTLSGGIEKDIRDLGSVLAAYNESGDNVALDPSLPPTGQTNNADPQGARDAGSSCEAYWDTEKVMKGKGKNK